MNGGAFEKTLMDRIPLHAEPVRNFEIYALLDMLCLGIWQT